MQRTSYYCNAFAAQPMTDKLLKLDPVARAALETYRESYNPLPVGHVDEFRTFFSLKNYRYLYKEIIRQCKGMLPDETELMDAMMWAFSSVAPRSDESDERRDLFGADITNSYVQEINKYVLEKMTAEVVSANMQADTYYKYRMHGPVDYLQDWGESDIDTRTRLVGSRANMFYFLP